MDAEHRHQLFERIDNHVGKKILEALRAYGTSARILSGNCFQLRHLIKVLEDPNRSMNTMGLEHRERLQTLFDELIRHFHNFLTSVTTLVDHTRNLMKEDFVKREHYDEYQTKVAMVFATDPLSRFMRDFRHYMTHHAIPLVGLEKEIGSPERDSKPALLYIDLNHLARWSQWTSLSRKFIDINKPTIRMLKLVDDYEQKVQAFHEEIGQAFQRYYEPEINEALALMRQFHQR